MSTIGIVPFLAPANLLVTFCLARKLTARGHQVVYYSIADHETTVRAQGFDFVPILHKFCPKGLLRAMAERAALKLPLPPKAWSLRGALSSWHGARRERAVQERYFQGGGLGAELAGRRPDLFLVHQEHDQLALATTRLGIPTLLHSSMLPNFFDPEVPPLSSGLLPPRSQAERAQILWEWTSRRARQLPAHLSTLDLRARTWWADRQAALPLLVFCPALFDFPRDPHRSYVSRLHYVEPSIDLARKAGGFDFYGRKPQPLSEEVLPEKAKLALVSLGTVSWASQAKAERILRAAIAAAAQDPALHFVIAHGDTIDPGTLGPIGGNVTLRTFMPQIELLSRAAVMVCHGGANTIKECLFFDVPVIALPLGSDQPGNAARLLYHGVGLAGDAASCDGRVLHSLLQRALSDQELHQRVRWMGQHFRALEERSPAVELVEAALRLGPSGVCRMTDLGPALLGADLAR